MFKKQSIIISVLFVMVLLGVSVVHAERMNLTPAEVARIEQAAKDGSAEAQYTLALYYLVSGDNNTKERKDIIYWLEQSSINGYAEAQYLLGFLYHTGDIVDKDFDKAFIYFEQAAAQGHKGAQRILLKSYVTE